MQRRRDRGVTLIDTMVAIGIMVIVFVGIAATFQLALDEVTNNKARAGAIALADQRMEYIRSLSYAAVGTSGGIPSGSIAQSEKVALNGVSYTRRTVVEYEDDPKDGSGSSDSNHITEDYKAVKVDVSWLSRTGTRDVVLVTRVSPANGLETTVPGGTISISAVDAAGDPLSGASVSIVDAGASPAVNLNTFTNASGTATLLGAPAATGYQVVVTEPGYSTAQTYSATSQNTSPSPGNLTVSNSKTTSSTFAIDVLGTKTVQTFMQLAIATTTDPFSDTSMIATSTNITVSGGTAHLSSSAASGQVQSIAIAPSYLAGWNLFAASATTPSGTSITYRFYDSTGTNLIPEAQLPGNAAGFTSSSVNLSGVSTSTYPSLTLDAVLSGTTSSTPSITSWSASYSYGPQPLPNIAFTLQGAKTIGSGPSGTVYKYSSTFNTGSSASITIPNLEWDNYTVSINGASTGYDIASACNPQPESLSPGASMTSSFYLTPHTANSLLVNVRAASTGALITGATVKVTRTGFSQSLTSDSCGQAYFGGLTSSNSYTVAVSASGHTTSTTNNVHVSGTSGLSVTLN